MNLLNPTTLAAVPTVCTLLAFLALGAQAQLATSSGETPSRQVVTREQCIQSAINPLPSDYGMYCYGIGGKKIDVLRQCISYRTVLDKHCAQSYDDIPLHLAGARASIEMVDMLIVAGANPRALTPRRGQTAIHVTVSLCPDKEARKGVCAEIVKRLISVGVDINATDEDGASAIWYAIDRPEIMEQLIPLGADINQRLRFIRPLDGAVIRQNPQAIALLRRHGAIEAGEFARKADTVRHAIASFPNWHIGH